MNDRQLELFDELPRNISNIEYKYSTTYDINDVQNYNISVTYGESSREFINESNTTVDIIYRTEIAQMQKALYSAYERIKQLSEELNNLKQGNKDA